MGPHVVKFGSFNLNIYLSVKEVLRKFSLSKIFVDLVPAHIVPLTEDAGCVPIDGGKKNKSFLLQDFYFGTFVPLAN